MQITESDVDFAANFNAAILGFNVTVPKTGTLNAVLSPAPCLKVDFVIFACALRRAVMKVVEKKNVVCKTHNIIYEVMDEIRVLSCPVRSCTACLRILSSAFGCSVHIDVVVFERTL